MTSSTTDPKEDTMLKEIKFKVTGENIHTGNTWECETDIPSEAEATVIRNGYARLESDYKIAY